MPDIVFTFFDRQAAQQSHCKACPALQSHRQPSKNNEDDFWSKLPTRNHLALVADLYNWVTLHYVLSRIEITAFQSQMFSGKYCPIHFIFRFLFFVSFGNEVTKISCHFQAKTVQLIFSFFVILTKIRKTKIVMNRTIMSNTATLIPTLSITTSGVKVEIFFTIFLSSFIVER